jgi:hypothetical protein
VSSGNRLPSPTGVADNSPMAALTAQLLTWIAERPRTYSDTIEAWKTSCPRLSVWEDALADELIRIERGSVVLTAAGSDLLSS